MRQISDETLKEIKDLLQEFRDDSDYEAGFCLAQCTKCMTGDCRACAAPYQRISEKCNEIIYTIDDILNE